MSAQTTEPTAAGNSAASEEHVASTTGMGGTSADNVEGADGDAGQTGEAQTEGEAQGDAPDEGAASASEAQGASPSAEVIAELEQLRSQARQLDPLLAAINRNPKLFNALQAEMFGTGDGGGEAASGVERSMKAIDDYFSESPANREALQNVVSPLVDEIRTLREKLGRMEPQVARSHQAAISVAFREGLSQYGVSPTDPGLAAALARERKSPSFQRLERSDPAYAAKVIAQSMRTTRTTTATNAAQSRRVADVKSGSLHSGSGVGNAGTAQKVVVVDKSKPGWDTEALAARIKHGPSVKIEFKK